MYYGQNHLLIDFLKMILANKIAEIWEIIFWEISFYEIN